MTQIRVPYPIVQQVNGGFGSKNTMTFATQYDATTNQPVYLDAIALSVIWSL